MTGCMTGTQNWPFCNVIYVCLLQLQPTHTLAAGSWWQHNSNTLNTTSCKLQTVRQNTGRDTGKRGGTHQVFAAPPPPG